MTSWKKALGLGLIVWLVPFVVAFAAFPLKASWRSLFESIMPVTLAIVVVVCGLLYLRRIPHVSLTEGILLGLFWWAISMAIDMPLMLSPPMSFSLSEYLADIGLTYALIPVITAGLTWKR